jgi:HEAT repeat protein
MRIMSLFASLLIWCCMGLAFSGPDTLNSSFIMAANPTVQDVAGDATADVKAKIQSLNSPNPRERAEAACTLGETRVSAAIPALIKTLGDDAPVDQPVCGQKGSWRDSEINKTSPGEMAAVALSRIGLPAVEPLIGALKTEAWQARGNAAFALGLIRDERSIEPLIAAVTDTEWHVRSKAAWSLGLVGDRRAVGAFGNRLKRWGVEGARRSCMGFGSEGR